jgi:hypothetical protein
MQVNLDALDLQTVQTPERSLNAVVTLGNCSLVANGQYMS